MHRKLAALVLPVLLLALGSCTRNGSLKNPFEKEPPFVPSAIPADFAVVVDENHDTYYARQHIRQVISTPDAMSRTTYTTFRDLNNVVSSNFTQETPLSPVQLQNMWNETAKHGLLEGAHTWVNWLGDSDLYKKDAYTIQIRAHGISRSYVQHQGFGGVLRPLMLQVEVVRLPISQDSKTHVIAPAGTPAPATTDPAPSPADPSMAPTTLPALPPAAQPPATAPAP